MSGSEGEESEQGEIALVHHPSGPACALRLTVLRASALQPSYVPVALSPAYHRGLGSHRNESHLLNSRKKNVLPRALIKCCIFFISHLNLLVC